MKSICPPNSRTTREDRNAFLATCETIYTRNRGCITPAEELICDLVRTYQAKGSLDAADIAFAQREFTESAELLKSARLTAA